MLVVRVPGQTLYLYIGRGNQYIGIFVSLKAPPSFLRVQDKFLDYVRSHLVGAKISRLNYESDGITELYKVQFKKDTENNYFSIGYHQRELFFITQEKDLCFTSWDNRIIPKVDLKLIESDFSKHFKILDIEKYVDDEEKKSVGVLERKKREKFLIRKIENIKKDIITSEKWKEIENELLEDQIDLSGVEVISHGQKFNLIGLKTDWEKKDFIFKRIKKMKRGFALLSERLQESEKELELTEKGQFKKEITKEKAIQVLWKVSGKNKKQESSSVGDYKEIHFKNLTGIIGLNANGNDQIRSMANKNHFWFHIENYTGSHLILKTDDIGRFTMEDFSFIASVLRDFSKLDILEIPIMFSQVKNLKGMKGVKGEVIVSKPKYMRCIYREWKEIISII